MNKEHDTDSVLDDLISNSPTPMRTVEYPIFEIGGPPCEVEGCRGTLIYTSTKDGCYQKCYVCNSIFHELSNKDLLKAVLNVLEEDHSLENLPAPKPSLIRPGGV